MAFNEDEFNFAVRKYVKSKYPELKGKYFFRYKRLIIGWVEGDTFEAFCILCETEKRINCRACTILMKKQEASSSSFTISAISVQRRASCAT